MNDYFDLLSKYKTLEEENIKLREEIAYLKSRQGVELSLLKDNEEVLSDISEVKLTTSIPQSINGISNNSFPEEKIQLYMSLFKGRSDVFARRWTNKSGKSGYSPVCANESVSGICNKYVIKCSDCDNRKYSDLDNNTINNHLRGKEVIGMYPLLEDECCFFLAIDFDDDGWEKDISAVKEICDEKKIPVAIERSRSGSGGHMWFFFDDKIRGSKARRFGTALLTYSMSKRHELKFSSYDRLFPNQDTMPKGGFGNLIALPLQAEARRSGNSVFIDNDFKPYDDQWKFLSSIKKLEEMEIEQFISELCSGSELGNLRQNDDAESKPWERRKNNDSLDESDLPNVVHITKANMIYIRKNGLSNKALNRIKRLAAFSNPEFYKAQAMRLSIYDKPRVISLSEETPEYIFIPRGCEDDLIKLINEYDKDVEIDDLRNTGKSIKVEFNGQLKEEQVEVFEALLQNDIGTLAATTGFGKTVIGARLISERKVNTLIIVHTRQLLSQWKERLEQFLTIKEECPENFTSKRGRKRKQSSIGQIGGGKNTPNGVIDIAIMQSLGKGDEVKDIVKNYGMVIVDECHHVPAFGFEQVLKNIDAKYVYGLTATPIRQDGHHPIIFMQCGPIRYKVDAIKQATQRPFDHYIIPRFTPFRILNSANSKELTIGEIYSQICFNELRNNHIIDDVFNCIDSGRNPIILTERTAHVEILWKALKQISPNVIKLTGAMSEKERKQEMDRLSSIPMESNIVIVATGKIVGEGFDEPRLDTLFLVMPVSWKGTVQQYAGRLHRIYENKNEVQIYDYVDVHIGILERMYQKRLKGYASLGYSVKGDSKSMDKTNTIYDDSNFFNAFSRDISLAKSEIIIVSPYMSKKQLQNTMDILLIGIINGAKITVVTRPWGNNKKLNEAHFSEIVESIEDRGINLILKTDVYQRFAIIDQRIIWYGSIDILSHTNSENSIMRIEDLSIANELISTIDDIQ